VPASVEEVVDPVITGGDAVVGALRDGGVTAVFGIPGGHNLDRVARGEALRYQLK
jgi:thiamine pyrophosphate-dependent acetolactate synthase large subunit-like protein